MTTTREQVARERARDALCKMLGWHPGAVARDERRKLIDELVSSIVEVVDAREAERFERSRRHAEDVYEAAETVLLEGTEYGSR